MVYSHVETAPEAGGSEFTVRQWEGWAFGSALGPSDDEPLHVLVWDESTPLSDDPKNWAEISVVEIEDDTFRYGAPADIEILAGMRVATIEPEADF